jgi:hypothetical protein
MSVNEKINDLSVMAVEMGNYIAGVADRLVNVKMELEGRLQGQKIAVSVLERNKTNGLYFNREHEALLESWKGEIKFLELVLSELGECNDSDKQAKGEQMVDANDGLDLENLIQERGLDLHALDDVVHDAASAMASNANNNGCHSQIEFLKHLAGWSDEDILKALGG